MVIKIVGTATTNYRTTCTDIDCRNILEFSSEDIVWNTISCMGRDGGRKRGISCPSCAQILTPDAFEEID